MKTTDMNSFERDNQKTEKQKILGEINKPSRSLRPQKSMVRVKSLKPKRLMKIKGIKPLNK
ncbi:MAG: hypothetical protein CME62_09665 [Halobacteriovoraceae bacterium]|nr:hypothetical protein [Halobacteriovoraceae bacterium]|tara:strand:+ start:27837 stop:28019 length:183 start_codon:yes stop_codon:yes gene_type:complete